MEALLAVVSVTVLFLLVNKYDAAVRKLKWWNRNRLLRKNAALTVSRAVEEYVYRNGYADLIKLKSHVEYVIVNEPHALKGLQKFLDQVLKMYAGDLQRAYDKEESLKKEFKGKDKPDSFSMEEIASIFKTEACINREKEEAEDNFWDLHDTLDLLGLPTLGHKSYRVYVCLKTMGPRVTLNF